MIVSMRESGLSSNSINSYTHTLKSFFSWCNEQGIAVHNYTRTRNTKNGQMNLKFYITPS